MSSIQNKPGKVYIVGAGPGAGDLITLRALRALRQADVVLYDALVSPDVLEEAPERAERIFVGKRCGIHAAEQREINQLLVTKAREGNLVVRLKGGDPLVFGRGGEEALACEEESIAFEIIPGVSSALGAAAFAGVPLTHRGVAASVGFVTASEQNSSDPSGNDWLGVAKAVDTLVIFMGGRKLHAIAEALIRAGRSPETPVAVISEATQPTQRTILGTLANIASRVDAASLPTPRLIVVGAVTEFSSSLNWFEKKYREAVVSQELL